MVLVELFTSEGCSSCPPADRALTFLQKEQPNSEAEIITLAFHVDYWDDLGWKDEFSSPLYTQRQQFYSRKFRLNSIYTPQMVVDGNFEFVGSDMGKAQKCISETLKAQKAKIEISKIENILKVNITDVPKSSDSTVYLAIAEDDLASDVKRGENSGNRLEHDSVVRELRLLGKIEESKRNFSTEFPLHLNPNWKPENLKLVVFIQVNQSREIIGVNSLNLT